MTNISKPRIVYITENHVLERFTKKAHFRLFESLKINFDFYIINISNIIKSNTVNIKKIENFKYLLPNNISELNNFLEENKDLAFLKLSINLKYHKIYILSLSNLIFATEDNKNFFLSKHPIHLPYIIKKINYYLYRLIVIFRFYPRIFCHFE